ncbi:uncharacterized protein VTP21DRAFT_5275 [Calcarisporiella thermophila]|uniref:uncharacterized protein n=1 Tax=Calcarisporiella thermophila TaxID=911321 RepID=UPI0037449FDC
MFARYSALLLLVLAVLSAQVNAWVARFESKDHVSTHFSREAKNDCYDINQEVVDQGVRGFKFCTIQAYQCEIRLFDERACKGHSLGHNGGRGYSWSKYPVSAKGSKMKSFRITGCLGDVPIIGKFKFDKFNIRDC